MPVRRIAGIDFGTVRIGIAVGDDEVRIASPHSQYQRQGPEQDAKFFQKLVADEAISLFVVGLPVHLSGRDSTISVAAEEFGRWLTKATGVPVRYFDERFTSAFADQAMLDANLTRKRRKGRRDMVAAQVMLAAFLESSVDQATDAVQRGSVQRGIDD